MTGGRNSSIGEIMADEYGSRKLHEIVLDNLGKSSKMWENKVLMHMGSFVEHSFIYRTNFCNDENADTVTKKFFESPGASRFPISKIHEEFCCVLRPMFSC